MIKKKSLGSIPDSGFASEDNKQVRVELREEASSIRAGGRTLVTTSTTIWRRHNRLEYN